MKKILSLIQTFVAHIENKWNRLNWRQQRRSILFLFTIYFCLFLIVIFRACIGGGRNSIAVDHIENPVIKKEPLDYKVDSLSDLLKNKFYENKRTR